jgi:hypothetical protein
MILIATSDIFFRSKLMQAAKSFGEQAEFAATHDSLVSKAKDARLVVVDLAEFSDLLPEVKAAGCKIIGYYPHAQGHLAARAQQVGCDMTLPRSTLVAKLGELIQLQKAGKKFEQETKY